MTDITRHCIVSGLVQGVWYRSETKDKAIQLGLTGWVKNLKTGQVELVVSGPEEGVQELCDWLWDGPSGSRVDDVTIEQIAFQDLSDFIIKYMD